MVNTVILLIILSVPLANIKYHSEARPVTVTSKPITLYNNFMTLIPNFTFIESQEVYME